MGNKDTELVSTKEVARLLNVTPQTILNMIYSGRGRLPPLVDSTALRLKGVKLGNATSPWRIRKDSAMKYIEQTEY